MCILLANHNLVFSAFFRLGIVQGCCFEHTYYVFNIEHVYYVFNMEKPGCVAQLVTCLATDASLTADPGVTSLIPAQPYTSVEIDHGNNFYGHSPPFH